MKYFVSVFGLLVLIGFVGIVFAEEIPIEIQTPNDIDLIISGTILDYKDEQRISILIKNELDNPIFVSQLIPNQSGYFYLNVTRQGVLWDTSESFTVHAFGSNIYDSETPLGLLEPGGTQIISPRKQINLGIPTHEIQCNANLILIQKYDGTPACVTYQTGEKLVKRGWATCDDGIDHNRGHPCGPHSGGIISFDSYKVEPKPDPKPTLESDLKQQQAKIHVQKVIMTDFRSSEYDIRAINEYRNEFESGYFLEQFIFSNKQNYEKDDLIHFVFAEWGYQPQECTSSKVEVYLRSYENYDKIEKISEWQKSEKECYSIDSDSNGYLIVNIRHMPGIFEPHDTCTIPGEYRVVVSNLEDESKKEWGYYTCQKDKLAGEPQPWMELPE